MIRKAAVLQGHGQTGEFESFHGGVLIVRVAHQDEMEPAVLHRSEWEAGATAPFATAGDGGGQFVPCRARLIAVLPSIGC